MNKTTGPSTIQLPADRRLGLTGATHPQSRTPKPMTRQESNSAFEKLLHLHSAAGEAVAQFAAIGAIREVIFRPGSVIFDAYQRDADDARTAVSSLGDSKADSLMTEIVNL